MSEQIQAIPTREYLKSIISSKLDVFNELIKWDKKDFEEYQVLLDRVEAVQPSKKKGNIQEEATTGDKGRALEELVAFIIRKSYFFKVHTNIHTPTNEIDLVITLTDRGKEALHTYELSRDLLHVKEDMFLGECKNYKTNVGVSWVGKFYGLLNTCGCNFGILFSNKGLTGQENGWHDSYGLIRVFSLIEKYKNNRDFFILEFNMKDYKKIAEGTNFFSLLEVKMKAIKIATTYEELLKENKHEAEQLILDVVCKLES